MLRRPLVRPQIFIPLGLIASQTLNAASTAGRIEAGERNGDASGVDAVHQ